MPDGIRWNLKVSPLRTIVWPALLPPWKRTTASACSASRSVIFPLPSSPHWAPTMTIPGTGRSLGRAAPDDLTVVGAHDRDDLAHLLEPRHGALGDLLDELAAVEVRRDHHRLLRLVAGVDHRVELLDHPRGGLLGPQVVDVQQVHAREPVEQLDVRAVAGVVV